jgi:hypothetical protein
VLERVDAGDHAAGAVTEREDGKPGSRDFASRTRPARSLTYSATLLTYYALAARSGAYLVRATNGGWHGAEHGRC